MNQNSNLSRREQIATTLLSSIVIKNGVYEDCVEHALELTDKLIDQLDSDEQEANS